MHKLYTASTNEIEVSVTPEFINNEVFDKGNKLFLWRYFVKIKNNSAQTIQIVKRYWKITHEDGSIQEIFGEGVVGKKPVLVPQLEFEYTSQVQLECSSAIMGGHYYAVKENGEILQITIPNFSLDIPNTQSTIN